MKVNVREAHSVSAKHALEERRHTMISYKENRVGSTSHVGPRMDTNVRHGADEIVKVTGQLAENDSANDRADPSANKALKGLFGRDFNQRRSTKRDAAKVSKNVIGDDERCRYKKPKNAGKDIVDNEVALHNSQ